MALNISDLQPRPFTVNLGKGGTTECKPLRMSHIFMLNKLGSVFVEPEKATREQIAAAEADFDFVIADLIPELAGVQLGLDTVMSLIGQMMETVNPSENKELDDKGVSFDPNPKVSGIEPSSERTG